MQPFQRPLERRVPGSGVLLSVKGQSRLGVVEDAVEREAVELLLFVGARQESPERVVLFGAEDGEPPGLDAGEAAPGREGPDAAEAGLAGLGLGSRAEAVAIVFGLGFFGRGGDRPG